MILTTVLSCALLGQVVLPGSALSLEQSQAKAGIILVGEVTEFGDIIGAGVISFTSVKVKHSAVLKGEVNAKGLQWVAVSASGHEVMPGKGEEYLIFIERYREHFTIVKMIPKTSGNIEAVKESIKVGKKP